MSRIWDGVDTDRDGHSQIPDTHGGGMMV